MIGVILANTGSPASPEPDDIERYLREFLMDDRIRQLPKPLWKYLLNRRILPKRKYSSAERYRFIWTDEGSPLVVKQQRLAEKIQALFDADNTDGAGDTSCAGCVCDAEGISNTGDTSNRGGANYGKVLVRSAMSYGSPSITDALHEMREVGVERVVLLPLYPQSAFSPTMAVVDSFWRAQDAIGWHPLSTVIDNYHDDPGYIAAVIRSIREAGFDSQVGDRLVLSLHAIPLKDEAAGDTYRAQVAESTRLIAEALGVEADSITVAFQSVFGPDKSKWTAPLTCDVLRNWRDGDFRVVLACPGFAIDCLETLYDIPHEMVPALEGEVALPVVDRVGDNIQVACNTAGRFVWVPTLNASDEHAMLLKAVIEGHI